MFKKVYNFYTTSVENLIDKLRERIEYQPSDYEITKQLILLIKPESFRDFNNQSTSTLSFDSPYSNIEIYIKKLEEVIFYLENDNIIYVNWCTEVLESVPATSFLLSKESFYIDEVDFIERFKEAALKYHELIHQCLKAQTGVKEHNSRILMHFTRCLESTIRSIVTLQ